jgi:uncharacterized protein (TIGR01777 family)
MAKIIITGGNGFLGKKLQERLKMLQIEYNILCRNPTTENEYKWDLDNNYIDERVFEGVNAIIHLAGENIGTKRWTTTQKTKIIQSRVLGTRLLYQYLVTKNHQIKSFIAASGVGIYGNGDDKWQTEKSDFGTDFLAQVCIQWENEIQKINTLNIRTVILRTGVVLDRHNGAFPKMLKPIQYSFGTYFGNGKQYLSWIHIEDIIGIYIHLLLSNTLAGTYNAVAPNPVTNKIFISTLSKKIKKPMFPFGITKLTLKLLLGEMSDILLLSNRCCANKILDTSYTFKYPEFEVAVEDLLKQ